MTVDLDGDRLSGLRRAGSDRVARLTQVRAEMEAHRGRDVLLRFQSLNRVHNVMRHNELDLLDLLELPNHDRDLRVELFQTLGIR